jgi:SSS family transporter
MNVHPLDLVMLAAYFGACLVLGWWLGRRSSSATQYMLGGRDVPAWAVLLSIVATETSTVTFLSIPGVAYRGDLRFLQLALGFVAGRLLVIAVLLPRYFQGELFTAYQVLHRRFGGATKQVASLLFLVTRSLADGLRLFLTALVLKELAGIGLAPAILITGLGTIVYTFLGGMTAVVWTDVLQFFVYVAGAALAFAILLGKLPGGLEQVLAQDQKLAVFDFRWSLTDNDTFWAGLFGGMFITFASHGVDQLMVQRYLCARSQRAAATALGLSGVVVFAQFAFFLLIGVALFCFYGTRPFATSDEVFTRFIVEELPRGVGVVGLVLGAVFAAAMSTLSSSLNSCATAVVNDLWGPWLRPHATPEQKVRAARAFTLAFGLAQIGVALAGPSFGGRSVVSLVLEIAALTTGIVLGIFCLGVLTRHVGQRAALVALVLGLMLVLALKFATPLAGYWYALVGSVATFAFGLAAQAVAGWRAAAGPA